MTIRNIDGHPDACACALCQSYRVEREATLKRNAAAPEYTNIRHFDRHPVGCMCRPCIGFRRGVSEAHGSPFKKKVLTQAHVEGCHCRPCVAVRNRLARAAERPAAQAAASAARANDPTVGAPDAPPCSNTGETERNRSVRLVLDGGKVKEVMVRLPSPGEIVFIDTLSFTVSENTWFKTAGMTLVSDEAIIGEASRVLELIFGFGISSQRPSGMNFYHQSWILGDGFGNVCFGGQRNTMQIILNGQGCINALEGWEQRLQTFLRDVAIRAVITRIDLAHDDFEGAYTSPELFDEAWDIGGFTCGFGEPPEIQHLGNWKRRKGKGVTLAVGRRTSGKYCRIYEKGCEQGDPNSKWCRTEVEFKSSDRVIPFDVLTSPSGYFLGAYPCFDLFESKQQPKKIEIKKKSAEVSVSHAKRVAYRQMGKLLFMLRELTGDDSALLDELCNTSDIPKRFKKLGASLASCPPSLHAMPPRALDLEAHLNSPATFAQRGVTAH